MTTRDEWLALAERCEKAKGPDRELDRDIAKASGLYIQSPISIISDTPRVISWTVDPDTGRQIPNAFTRSLDAAVAVMDARFGRTWKLEWRCNEAGTGFVFAGVARKSGHSYGSPALALMAAYCRARAEEETT